MRAEITLPLGPVGLVGDFAASFNHGLSNGSTFYTRYTINWVFSILC